MELPQQTLHRRHRLNLPRPDRAVGLAILVGGIVLGLLVVDALNYLTETIELGGWTPWLSFEDGRLATLLMAALSAGAGGTAIRHGVGANTGAGYLPRRAVWFAFGLGCLVIGALDVLDVVLSAGESDALGLVPLITGAIIAWRLRRQKLVAWLIAAGLLLIILSPVAGAIEVDIFTNPDNYTPGAPGEPYPIKHTPWIELWWVSRFQELSELGAMACFLIALRQVVANAPERRRNAQPAGPSGSR